VGSYVAVLFIVRRLIFRKIRTNTFRAKSEEAYDRLAQMGGSDLPKSKLAASVQQLHVQQLHVQQPSTHAKPEAASAVLGS